MWGNGQIDIKNLKLLDIPQNTSLIFAKNGRVINRFGDIYATKSIRSISKALTSIAILQAYDQGILDLEYDLAPILNSYSLSFPNLRILDILNQHVLSQEKLFSYDVSTHTSRDTISQIFSKDIIVTDDFCYTNSSFYLLGVLLENKLGKGFIRNLIIEKIFYPLGIEKFEFKTTKDNYTYAASSIKLSTDSLFRIACNIFNNNIINSKHINEIQQSRNIVHSSNRLKLEFFNKRFYQYGFWICAGNVFYADGKNGQVCIIDKKNEVVIVALSDNYDTNQLLKEIEKLYIGDT